MAQVMKLRNEEPPGGVGAPIPVPGFLSRLVEYPRRARQFLHEVRNQMRLVTWPSWDDVYSTTVVVVITVTFFALFFWIVDSGLGNMSQWVLKQFRH